MIKLIIFDLWYTLIYKKQSTNTRELMYSMCPQKISLSEFSKISTTVIQTKKWNSKLEAYEELARQSQLDKPKEIAKRWFELRKSKDSKFLTYDYVIPLLKKLSQNYKLGLISNCTYYSAEIMKKETSIFDYIDYEILSFQVGLLKPDLNIFLKMLEKANVKPEEALMIGDNLNNDIIPCKILGLNAIHFTGDSNKLKKDLINLDLKI